MRLKLLTMGILLLASMYSIFAEEPALKDGNFDEGFRYWRKVNGNIQIVELENLDRVVHAAQIVCDKESFSALQFVLGAKRRNPIFFGKLLTKEEKGDIIQLIYAIDCINCLKEDFQDVQSMEKILCPRSGGIPVFIRFLFQRNVLCGK